MYKAFEELLRKVEVDFLKISEPLVQTTLVAGPPVETQMRVNNGIFSLKRELRVNVILRIFTDPENIIQVDQMMYFGIFI